jgi:hypothetical protein
MLNILQRTAEIEGMQIRVEAGPHVALELDLYADSAAQAQTPVLFAFLCFFDVESS